MILERDVILIKSIRVIGLLLIIVLALVACDSGSSNNSVNTPNQSSNPGGGNNANNSGAPQPALNLTVRPGRVYNCFTDAPNPTYQTIRLGLLSTLDALPMHAACLRGFYDDENVNVQFVPFTIDSDRDAAFKNGTIDAEIGDVVVSAKLAKDDLGVTVAVIFETNADRAVFSVVAAPVSAVTSLAGLKGKQIAITDNTISDYLTDYLFAKQGLDKSKGGFITQSFPDASTQLSALQTGKVAAATLPEPFASVALSAGATLLGSDKGTDLGAESVIIFSRQFTAAHPDAIHRFLAAYYRIITDINANFNSYRKLIWTQKLTDTTVAKTIAPITFAKPRVPTAAEIKGVSDWARQKGIITTDLDYSKMVDGSFLPRQ